jgi:hypothetical protein
MSDDEILAIRSKRVKGGKITVHELWNGDVLYTARRDGDDEWRWLRMPRETFVKAYEAAA